MKSLSKQLNRFEVDETLQLIDTILAENITLATMYQKDITADGQELLYLNVTGIYN